MNKNTASEVTALREKLKNERIDRASEDSERDDNDNDISFRTAVQDARGKIGNPSEYSNFTEGDNGKHTDNGRSVKNVIKRKRSTNRRSSEDSSSSASISDTADTTIGNIVTNTIPTRDFNIELPDSLFDANNKISDKYPGLSDILLNNPKIKIEDLAKKLGCSTGTAHKLRSSWQTSQPIIDKVHPQQSVKKKNVFSDKEADERKKPLACALESNFEALDQYLWYRQLLVGIDSQNQPVWSNLDDDEINKLVDLSLRYAQKNEVTAIVIDGVIESADYISVATIFVPRIKETVDIVRKTRKPRVKRGQREN